MTVTVLPGNQLKWKPLNFLFNVLTIVLASCSQMLLYVVHCIVWGLKESILQLLLWLWQISFRRNKIGFQESQTTKVFEKQMWHRIVLKFPKFGIKPGTWKQKCYSSLQTWFDLQIQWLLFLPHLTLIFSLFFLEKGRLLWKQLCLSIYASATEISVYFFKLLAFFSYCVIKKCTCLENTMSLYIRISYIFLIVNNKNIYIWIDTSAWLWVQDKLLIGCLGFMAYQPL